MIFEKRRFGLKFTDTQINKLEDTLKTNFKDNVDDVFNNNIPEHFLKYYDYPFLNDVSVKQIEARGRNREKWNYSC